MKHETNRMKNQLKRNYIVDTLADCEGDMEKAWKTIRSIWPEYGKSRIITEILGDRSSRGKADKLNTHFATVGTRLSEEIESENDDSYPGLPNNAPIFYFKTLHLK